MIATWLKRLRRRRGAGLIVVMVLAAAMGSYLLTNGVALRSLQKRLGLIEQRHQERWESLDRAPARPSAR